MTFIRHLRNMQEKADKQVLYSAEPTLVYGDEQPAPYEGNLNVKLDLSKYREKDIRFLFIEITDRRA